MKIKKFLIILLCFLCLPIFVDARGGISLSKSSGSIYVGDSTTFKITASNSVGKITVSVDDGSIASINKSSEWIENESITVTVKGKKIGSTNVKVHLDDVSTFDSETLSGKTYTYKVTVKEKPNYSKNNNLKSISIEGFDLQKKDNNNYYLIVNKNVEFIKINASAEDEKAKVSNTGSKKLKIGENKFEVVINSESGSKNTINVVVVRREGYALNDLKEIINEKDIELSLDSDNIIKKSDLDLIQKNKKIVKMDYFDENKNNIYSWIFDGSKINETMDIKSNIKISHNNEEVSEMINYPYALYIDFAHSGKLVGGTKININVKDYFKDNDKLILYYYNKETNEFELVNDNITVKDNYAILEIDHCSTYFLTKSTINANNKGKSNNILTIIFGVISFLELLVIGYLINSNKNKNIVSNIINKKNNNTY